MGIALLACALGFGAGLAALLTAFPPLSSPLSSRLQGSSISASCETSASPGHGHLRSPSGSSAFRFTSRTRTGGGLIVYWGLRLAGALALAPARARPRWTTGLPAWGIDPVPRLRTLGLLDQLALWGNLGVSLLVLVIGAPSSPPRRSAMRSWRFSSAA